MSGRKSNMKKVEIYDFLKDHGFEKHRAPSGGSSHSTWMHSISDTVITVCDNPAQGTLDNMMKNAKDIHFTAIMSKEHENADKYILPAEKAEYNKVVSEKRPDLLPKKKSDRQRLAKLRGDLRDFRQKARQYYRGLSEEKPKMPRNVKLYQRRSPNSSQL